MAKIYQDDQGNRFVFDKKRGDFVPAVEADVIGQPPAEGFDFSGAQMAMNVPGSAGQLARDIATPFIHPVDTGKALFNLAQGFAAKLYPGKQEQEFYADQFFQMLKDRYGSVDAFQRTLEQDPIGVLSDVAGIAMGGGAAVAKQSGRVGRAGQMISDVGRQIDPASIAIQAAGKGVSKIPKIEDIAEALYESGAKFPTSTRGSARKAAKIREQNVKTALRERIAPTQKGVQKVDRIIGEINDTLDDIIDRAVDEGVTVSVRPMFEELNAIIDQRDVPGPNRAKDVSRLKKLRDQLHKSLDGRTELTPREMQRIKKDIFERVDFAQRRGTSRFIREEGEKAIARGARRGVSGVDPRIDELNARQAALLELRDPLARASNRASNRNPIGIDTPLMMSAGGIAGGGAGAAGRAAGVTAGGAMGLFQNPRIMTRAAIILQQLIDAGHAPEAAAKLAPLLALQGSKFAGRAGQEQALQ